MREHRSHDNRTPLGVMLFIGLTACATAAWAQDRGTCIAAEVPEAFTLPDGSAHAAGRLTLCTHQALNPVVGLHLVRLADGETSFVMSQRSKPREFTDSRPVLLFRRAPDGALDLVGYVVPFDHVAWSYVLRHANGNGANNTAARSETQPEGELVTLIASDVR